MTKVETDKQKRERIFRHFVPPIDKDILPAALPSAPSPLPPVPTVPEQPGAGDPMQRINASAHYALGLPPTSAPAVSLKGLAFITPAQAASKRLNELPVMAQKYLDMIYEDLTGELLMNPQADQFFFQFQEVPEDVIFLVRQAINALGWQTVYDISEHKLTFILPEMPMGETGETLPVVFKNQAL